MEGHGYRRTTLDNGLRVVTETMPSTRSVAVSVYVGAGSRYETPEQAGMSHLLEHLLFKGTDEAPDAAGDLRADRGRGRRDERRHRPRADGLLREGRRASTSTAPPMC